MTRTNMSLAAPVRNLLLTAVAGLAGLLAPAGADATGADAAGSGAPAVVEAVSPSVVSVSVFFTRDPKRHGDLDAPDAVRVMRPGSGVIVGSSGLVVTNWHLVAEVLDADGEPSADYWAIVTLSNGRRLYARVLAHDERTDLALLQVNAGAQRLSALPLGDPQRLLPGEPVLALRYSLSGELNVYAGVLAFPGGPTTLRAGELAQEEMLLSDARFHHSLDGGPLVDMRGRVLGVHNSSHVSSQRERFQEEEEEGDVLKKPDEDYAVVVSADAIRAVFAKWLSDQPPGTPVRAEGSGAAARAIAAIAPSVVSVWTAEGEPHPTLPDPKDPHSQRVPATLGSGVVIDPSGLVLASSELFAEDAEVASVRVATGELYSARRLRSSSKSKVALLEVALPEGVELHAAVLADSAAALEGELIAVVGRPFQNLTLSVGVLSALGREGFVQVATWVHRGHVGGALVDRNGRLFGIATDPPASAMGVSERSYLGFAVPLATLLDAFQEELAARGTPAPLAYGEDELEARRSAATRVVERTKGSLVNVLVSVAVQAPSTGFNPFGGPEPSFNLLGQGSGVIVDPSGLAITNWHVVGSAVDSEGAHKEDHLVEVTLPTGERYVATVLSTSRDDDLALISLRLAPGESLVPVELGDSDELAVGQAVFAIGNPLGLANSVSAGIVSCDRLDVRIQGRLREYKGMVMTDAAVNPGNSGGALLDENARLVGINSAGRVGAGMAIPVNKAREVFSDKLLSAENLRSSYLGVRVVEQDGALVVASVDLDGPASRATLEIDDEILSIDGAPVRTAVGFAQVQRDATPGAPLALRVGRHGGELDLTLDPISYAAWRIFRQSGVLVAELDYASEAALVHEASIALHRAYTGDPHGRPARLMHGALRVVRVTPIEGDRDHPLRTGDLLLGTTTYVRGTTTDSQHLSRFEELADLNVAFDARATKEGEWCECWLLRDGEIVTAKVWVRRPPR